MQRQRQRWFLQQPFEPHTQPSCSLHPREPCTPILQCAREDYTYHTHTSCTTCADAEGVRGAEDREEWFLGDPKQPAHTQLAAQQAARARTAVSQSRVGGVHWHMVEIHLAGARECGNCSTSAAEGACCERHRRCVSRRARLRGPVAMCGRHAVCSMLQQAGCRHRQ